MKTINELFEEQTKKTPNNIALTLNEHNMTYAELNAKANQLAYILRNKGVKSDVIVALILDRSFEMIIAILAVLKAGGAYLPIDPLYPDDRVSFMLEDSVTRIIITTKSRETNFDLYGEKIIFDQKIAGRNENLPIVNTNNDLAYVIYTSGTTGKPKGVMIEHRSVIGLLFNKETQLSFSQSDVWPMFHTYCFDASVWEMYGALLFGGRLVLIPKDIQQNMKKYLQLLKKEKITVLTKTPTTFYNLMKEELDCKWAEISLRYIIFCGEALNVSKLKPWYIKYPSVELINMYGITEITVHATFKKITEEDITIGKSNIGVAISNVEIRLLNEQLQSVPVGFEGEICVTGNGVARGYLNRPELTAMKFINSPFNENEKMYMSGDIAKLLPNGEMEFLGRKDSQVKIRGFRVELGEIESSLLSYPLIKGAVVVAIDDKEETKLCAYIISNHKLVLAEIRKLLAKKLPDYMIPAYFVQIDEVPVNANTKLDKTQLPKPTSENILKTETVLVVPKNKLQQQIVDIWEQLLGLSPIGIKENFFDLGGDSLIAMDVAKEMNKEGITIDANEILAYQNIEAIYNYLIDLPIHNDKIEDGQFKVKDASTSVPGLTKINLSNIFRQVNKENKVYANIITSGVPCKYYPVAPAQLLLSVLPKMPIVSIIHFYTEVSILRLEEAFERIVKQQEQLRSILFKKNKKYCWQVFNFTKKIRVPFVDLTVYDVTCQQEAIIKIIQTLYQEKFKKSPLLYKVIIIKLNSKEYQFLIVADHIIYDLISANILKKKLINYYYGENSYTVKSFFDFAAKVNRLPTKVTEIEVIDTLNLREYAHYKRELEKIVLKKRRSKIQVTYLKYFIDIPRHYNEKDVWALSFTMFTLFVKRYLGFDKVPMKIMHHGRRFQNESYFSTIGLLLDVIPLIVPVDETNLLKIPSYAYQTLEYVAKNGINFYRCYQEILMFLLNKSWGRFAIKMGPYLFKSKLLKLHKFALKHGININKFILDKIKKQPWGTLNSLIAHETIEIGYQTIVFNFMGKFKPSTKEEQVLLDENDAQISRLADMLTFYTDVRYNDKQIELNLYSSIESDKDKLIGIMDEVAKLVNIYLRSSRF